MRHDFGLHAYVGEKHLDAMAKLLLVTSLVLTYFYACDVYRLVQRRPDRARLVPLPDDGQLRVGGRAPVRLHYHRPLVLFWRRPRTSPVALFVVSLLVLVGMWFERFNIIVPSLAHDFYPYTSGLYVPFVVDSMSTVASFAWFFLLFLGFIRVMPSLSIADVKETLPPPLAAPRAPSVSAAG